LFLPRLHPGDGADHPHLMLLRQRLGQIEVKPSPDGVMGVGEVVGDEKKTHGGGWATTFREFQCGKAVVGPLVKGKASPIPTRPPQGPPFPPPRTVPLPPTAYMV